MASSSELPSHRACTACRAQKVRCTLDETTNSSQCQRCIRTGRSCRFTPLHKQKQRVRTDTRVAELEKEMRRMRRELGQKEEGEPVRSGANLGQSARPGGPPGMWYQDSADPTHHFLDDSNTTNPAGRNWPTLWSSSWSAAKRPIKVERDVVDRGVISLAAARQLLDVFRTDLIPHLPLVLVDISVSVEELRRTKPALFLAIIAAAAGKHQPDMSARLDQEVVQIYANHNLVNLDKNIEMIQALLISSIWFQPPSKFDQVRYYEFIHMATTMALDIGIGSRSASHRRGRQQQMSFNVLISEETSTASQSHGTDLDTASIESRRTYLACYIMCGAVALSLRRPCMLRASAYIRDCADFLESSSQAPTDPMLVAWARLMMVGEEIATAFSYDDPGEIALLTDIRTQMMLKDFATRLCSWRTDLPESDESASFLLLMYNTIRLYLFEIALHVDHSPEDFRAPYQMGDVEPLLDAYQIPVNILSNAVSECILASHSLMDIFISMDIDSLRAIPVLGYVRVSFAAFVLAKLCQSSAHANSRIGAVLEKESLRVKAYMDRAVQHVRNIIGAYNFRVPSIFLGLLFKLRQWCLQPSSVTQISKQRPNLGEADSTAINAEKPKGSTIDFEKSRITEHFGCREASPQAMVNVPRSSLQALKMDAIGMTPGPQAGDLQQLDGHDPVAAPVDGWLGSMAGDQSELPTDMPNMQHPGSLSTYNHSNVDFANMAFPECGLMGFDFWPETDQKNGAQNNLYSWPGGTGFG